MLVISAVLNKLGEVRGIVWEWLTGFFSGGPVTDILAWFMLVWGVGVLLLMVASAGSRFWAYCTYRVAGTMNNAYIQSSLGGDFLFDPYTRSLLFRLRWLAKHSPGSGEFWAAAEQLDAVGKLTPREQQVLAKAVSDAYEHAFATAPSSARFMESIADLRTAAEKL
jgi:hypothetical protein